MKFFLTFLLMLAALAPQAAHAQEAAIPSIAVLADNSLTEPLAELARAYTRESQIAVVLSPAGPQEENRQIAEGAAADVLITAKKGLIESLRQQGLVDVYSETAITSDTLVLAGPPDSPLEADLRKGFPTPQLIGLKGQELVLVLGNPETLVEGSFAREALRRMDADADMESYILYPKLRRQLYSAINTQGAYGILLGSNAHQQGMHVIDAMPDDTYTPILYKAEVLASENMNEARKFVAFLKGATARKIFEAYGFGTK